jgi:hypothetical protein
MAAENRRTARLPCRVPVRILFPGHWPDVMVLDMSRTGIRFALPLTALTQAPDPTLGDVAEGLRYVLRLQLTVEFSPETLGGLIQRSAKVVRIVRSRQQEGTVELGCLLEPVLTEEEGAFLGLPLPPLAEPTAAESPRARRIASVPPPPPVASRSDDGCDLAPAEAVRCERPASVISRRLGRDRTLKGRTEHIGAEGGSLWVSTDAHEALRHFPDSLPDKVIAFEKTYGPDVDVSIEDGSRFLWYGPVRVVGVETVPTLPGCLRIGFDFGRRLDRRELDALGVVG